MESLNEIILLDTLSCWALGQGAGRQPGPPALRYLLLSTVATSVVVKHLFRLHLASPLDLCTDQEPPKATHLIWRAQTLAEAERAAQLPPLLAL